MTTRRKRAIYPGVQFPLDAYEQFMKQGVPRWVTTDEQIIAAYIELVDKVCPCVVLVHSQAGIVRLQGRGSAPRQDQGAGRGRAVRHRQQGQGRALKGIPMAVIYGDNAKEHPRWGQIRRNVVGYADTIKSAGGSVDLIDLPDIGIKGNTHMVMMDRNSDEVADVIQKWLVSRNLVD